MRRSLIIAPLAWTLPVHAQVSDALEGPGIKLGEGVVFHPSLSLDTTYDSNVHYEDDSESPEGSPYLRINGHTDLASLSAQRLGETEPALDFRLGLGFGYREYLTSDEDIKELRALDLDGDLRVTINPRGFVYLKLYDQFMRVREPTNAEGPHTVTQDHNRVGTEIGVRPGGGVTTAALGYELNAKFFEEGRYTRELGADPDSHWHVLRGSGKWKFLPKTAITLDVTYSIYEKAEPVWVDSTALRGYLGLAGLITHKVSAVAKVGLGRANYDERLEGSPHGQTKDLSTVIGQVQVDWRVALQSKLSVGYERLFEDSVNADYYVDDYLYASYEHLIAGRTLVSLKPGLRLRRYSGSFSPITGQSGVVADEADREDVLAGLEAGVTYQVLSWFLVGGAYRLEVDSTDSGTENTGDNAYVKHVVLLRLEAAY